MSFHRKREGTRKGLGCFFKERDKPVHFWLLCIIKLLFSFSFTMFKLQKESNVVLKNGAESIPSTKILVFIISLLVVYIYTSLGNRLQQESLFYGILLFFFVSFLLYSFVIIPNIDAFLPDTTGLKKRFAGNAWVLNWVGLYADWPIVLFYTFAELWGQFCIVVFFWGIANEVYGRGDAKRFYHFFIAAGCLGGILGSFATHTIFKYCSSIADNKVFLDNTSRITGVIAMVILVIVAGLFRWISKTRTREQKTDENSENKVKLSFWESIRYIASDRSLIAQAMMVIACGLTMNLINVTYNSYIKAAKVNQEYTKNFMDFIEFKINVMLILNVSSILACFLLIPFLMKYLSWKMVSYLTPTIVLLLGGSFFLSSTLKGWGVLGFLGDQDAQKDWILSIGRIYKIGGTLAKYVLFDQVKEIAYIGLGVKAKRKAKASIDVIGSRFGKGLSSFIHMALMYFFVASEDVTIISPHLLFIFICLIIVWFHSIRYLSKTLEEKQVINTDINPYLTERTKVK